MMQKAGKALYFMESGIIVDEPSPQPMGDTVFHRYLDSLGRLTDARQLRMKVYQCGLDPSLRYVIFRNFQIVSGFQTLKDSPLLP